jgi:putative ATP-binding cassette transporter
MAAKDFSNINFRLLALFAICVAGFIFAKKYALRQIAVISRTAVYKTYVGIADNIRRAGLVSFEDLGSEQVYTTLSENTEIIFEASRRLVGSTASMVMLTFSFAYIIFLSVAAFWISITIISCTVVVYLFNQKTINMELRSAIEKENEFFDFMKHLLQGFKELKMNMARSNDLFQNYLTRISDSARELKIHTEFKFITNYIFAQVFFYILLASIIFLLPQFTVTTPSVMVQIIAVLLFMLGPLGDVVDSLPMLAKGNVAVEKIERLEEVLGSFDDTQDTAAENPFDGKSAFSQISMKRIEFSYPERGGQRMFSVGPVNLSIGGGEIIFIVGGNGSGKTTFLKLLTGLYHPKRGAMFLDDIPLDSSNIAYYRNFFSVIFSDYHLFDRMYGLDGVDEKKVNHLLADMGLDEKTAYRKGRFTNINLSTGQKKRLALITALMDDKPVCIFDEVAADQDPEYRKYFYEVILKDLRDKGKTVIAATHDDRYFHVADRVLKLDYGKFIN